VKWWQEPITNFGMYLLSFVSQTILVRWVKYWAYKGVNKFAHFFTDLAQYLTRVENVMVPHSEGKLPLVNIRLARKNLARGKHYGQFVSDKKKFLDIEWRCRYNKTFYGRQYFRFLRVKWSDCHLTSATSTLV